MSPMRALGAVAVALTLGACFEVDVEEAPSTCDASSACPVGHQCDVETHACTPLEEGRLQGRFACDVVGPMGVDEHTLPGSDVMGQIDGAQLLLPLGAQCDVTPYGEVVLLLTSIGAAQTALVVKLPPDVAATGGQASIVPATTSYLDVPDGVAVATLQARGDGRSAVIARATDGALTLDGPATPGARVRGTIDVRVVPLPSGAVAPGLPCPEGVHQCGPRVDAMCSAILYPDAPICVSACASDAECPATHRCTDVGACQLRCTTDEVCPAPLLCAVAGRVCE
ncbi:MAG: hypothetical protein IT374_16615 [Polyangiaceae bacterium]|nr:hypothetical protein [Polyangiaceae bacterium]